MKKSIPLRTIQHWMQSVIEHPGTNEAAWRSDEAQNHIPAEEAEALVRSSPALSSVDRIGIYRKMFFLRMTESMAIDYPAVKHFFGEEAFDRLIVEEYIRQYPSTSHTLNHLGRHFPEFFAQSRHPEKDFLHDLSRLELAITNNMDAEESPHLSSAEIAAILPEQWENVILVPIAALEVLTFDYPVCEYADAVYEEKLVPAIRRERSAAVVYRHRFRTMWEPLTEPQAELLRSFLAGKTFGKSIEHLAERFPAPHTQLQNDLFRWFDSWVSAGFFSTLKHP